MGIPIHFVDKRLNEKALDKINFLIKEGVDSSPETFNTNTSVWIWQTYIHLKKRNNFNITIGNKLIKEGINIVHRAALQPEDFNGHFIVSIRSDTHACFQADLEILQNSYSRWKSNDHYIPHWPQPALIPRESSNATIKTISFFGKHDHLKSEFKSDKFVAQLNNIGCNLNIQENFWWDYSKTDLVVAIRDGHKFYLDCKPASKLVNSWLAGCPVILSPEAAYKELRKSSLDFFEAKSPEEVLGIIKMLKDNPTTYKKMVTNGRERARKYTVEKIAQRWENLISEKIVPLYLKTKKSNSSLVKNDLQTLISYARERILGWHATRYPNNSLRLSVTYLRISISTPKFILRTIFRLNRIPKELK